MHILRLTSVLLDTVGHLHDKGGGFVMASLCFTFFPAIKAFEIDGDLIVRFMQEFKAIKSIVSGLT
jgi:hypothetical protein